MIKTITPPAAEPITLADAKAHLRVDYADDDALITALIAVTREQAESITGLALLTRTVSQTGELKPDGAQVLFVMPVIDVLTASVDGVASTYTQYGSVVVIDAAGIEYELTYTAGAYTDAASIPQAIKQWMLLKIGTLYANRESDSAMAVTKNPFVDGLLDPYRIMSL